MTTGRINQVSYYDPRPETLHIIAEANYGVHITQACTTPYDYQAQALTRTRRRHSIAHALTFFPEPVQAKDL